MVLRMFAALEFDTIARLIEGVGPMGDLGQFLIDDLTSETNTRSTGFSTRPESPLDRLVRRAVGGGILAEYVVLLRQPSRLARMSFVLR